MNQCHPERHRHGEGEARQSLHANKLKNGRTVERQRGQYVISRDSKTGGIGAQHDLNTRPMLGFHCETPVRGALLQSRRFGVIVTAGQVPTGHGAIWCRSAAIGVDNSTNCRRFRHRSIVRGGNDQQN